MRRVFSQGWLWTSAPLKAKVEDWARGGSGKRCKVGVGEKLVKTWSLGRGREQVTAQLELFLL